MQFSRVQNPAVILAEIIEDLQQKHGTAKVPNWV